MADRIKFAVSAMPIETITDENSGSHDILASEVGRSLAGSGDSVNLTSYATAANIQGYLNAAVNYRDATHAAGGVVLNDSGGGDFFFIKNTGYVYSSATVLGASTTNCVMVVIKVTAHSEGSAGGWQTGANADDDQYLEIAWLKPGQAIVLPTAASNLSITQFGDTAGDLSKLNEDSGSDSQVCLIYVRTYLSNGSAASDGNAVEFLNVY